MGIFAKLRQNRRTIENLRDVKEALDTWPNAVGYFDSYGMIKLYNRRMAALYYTLAGKEVQDLEELRSALNGLGPEDKVKHLMDAPNHYLFPDNTVWKYTESGINMGGGVFYTEVIFSEETQLYQKGVELKNQAAELQKIAKNLSRLSEEVQVLTKEEEILAAKTRLHDEMGSALVAARAGFAHPDQPEIADSAVAMLKKAVSAIKNDNEYEAGKGSLSELLEDAASIGVSIEFCGELPGEARAQAVFLSAIRECLTNAVRHAGADALYVTIEKNTITITNNGEAPRGEIIPRGGLLNLKHRVTAMEGTMHIRWTPEFCLTIRIPV